MLTVHMASHSAKQMCLFEPSVCGVSSLWPLIGPWVQVWVTWMVHGRLSSASLRSDISGLDVMCKDRTFCLADKITTQVGTNLYFTAAHHER